MSEVEINYGKTNNDNNKKPPSSKDKKKGGSMNIIKVALHKLRNTKKDGLNKPSNNKSVLSESTNTALTEIMGSVRPLYLQSSVGDMSPDRYETFPYQQPTPCDASSSTSRSSSRSSSHVGGGMSSKYASAQSLYDLDNHDDDVIDEENDEIDDGDAYYDGLEGDELIDAKAELFIANFYQQMRLQN